MFLNPKFNRSIKCNNFHFWIFSDVFFYFETIWKIHRIFKDFKLLFLFKNVYLRSSENHLTQPCYDLNFQLGKLFNANTGELLNEYPQIVKLLASKAKYSYKSASKAKYSYKSALQQTNDDSNSGRVNYDFFSSIEKKNKFKELNVAGSIKLKLLSLDLGSNASASFEHNKNATSTTVSYHLIYSITGQLGFQSLRKIHVK